MSSIQIYYYYHVEIPLKMDIDDYIQMDHWLWDEIGEENNNWKWGEPANYLYFTSEEDRVKFILRWL